jgi:hypothetical protein
MYPSSLLKGEKSDTFRQSMIRGKEQPRIKGYCLEKRGLRREKLYIETHNATRNGARKNNRKVLEKGG